MPHKNPDEAAKYKKEQWATRKASGLCVECGGVRTVSRRVPGRPSLYCEACLTRKLASRRKSGLSHRQRLRAKGLCGDCGRVETGGAYCEGCRKRRMHEYHTKYREKRIAAHKVAHQALKQLVFATYGGAKCACCGELHQEFLSIDHANGDGAAHRKSIGVPNGTGGNIYGWLKRNKFPEGFRVLCMNCNFALGHFGYCPHQREVSA